MGPVENEVNDQEYESDDFSGTAGTDFVNDWEDSHKSTPNDQITSIMTGPQVGLAKEEKVGRKLYLDTVKAEQREKFLRSLLRAEVGTNRMESNQAKSRGELKRDSGRMVGDIVKEMEQKTTDAKREADKTRWNRNLWRKKVEHDKEEISKGQVQKVISKLKKESDVLREELRVKNKKSRDHKKRARNG